MRRQYTPGPLPFRVFSDVELICEQCAVRFVVSRKKRTQRFCSVPCRGLAMRTKVARSCMQCGAAVPIESIRNTAPSRGRYCSAACFNLGRVKPLADRFWAKVAKTDACWFWTGMADSDGYGRLKIQHRPQRRLLAHRVSWELHHGPIPDGLLVLHQCDTPPCVRPEHLFLGTEADNHRDAVSKGRQSRGETHAPAILTEADVVEMRRLAAQGVRRRDLVGRYGVKRGAIDAVVARRTWRHL